MSVEPSPAEVKVYVEPLSSASYAARGGSTAHTITFNAEAPDQHIILFGGADRAGDHYNDVYEFAASKKSAKKLVCTGEIPPAVGGHASFTVQQVTSSSNTVGDPSPRMIVYGGINFVEEAVYDDVFELALDNVEGSISGKWRRVVTEGEVPLARTGHTFVNIPVAERLSTEKALHSTSLLFGGSSPVEGPMNDLHALYVFETSEPSATTSSGSAAPSEPLTSYKYRWQPIGTTGDAPEQREMHASIFRPGSGAFSPAITLRKSTDAVNEEEGPHSMIVIGGRNGEGKALRTLHVLNLANMSWGKPVKTPYPCVSAAFCYSADAKVLYMYGGWSGDMSLSSDLIMLDTRTGPATSPDKWLWSRVDLTPKPLPPPRFACSAALVPHAASAQSSLFVFGGMNIEKDLNDVIEFSGL